MPSATKQNQADWKNLYEISATLSLFLEIMNSHLQAEKPTNSNLPQLMVLHLIAHRGLHGGSLGGEYGIAFCNQLRKIRKDTKVQCRVLDAMQNGLCRIFNSEPFDHFRFEISEKGGLIIDCPGDACGINPSDWSQISPDRGYEFGCHNVDTPAQQLILLIGLAILHQEVDKTLHCL